MNYKDVIEKRAFARNTIIKPLYDKGFKKLAYSISHCADFIDYALCLDCNTLHYNGFSSCKERICPICSKKRSLLLFKRFVPVFRNLLNEGYYINGLNFTIVNTDNLAKSIEVINKAFRYIQGGSKSIRKEFNRRFVGGLRSLEIKLGENSKLWHPHLHCLVVKKEYSRDFDFLSEVWNKAVKLAGGEESKTTPGLYGLVSIFSLVDKKNANTDKEKSIEIGTLETLKYITKFDYDIDSDRIPELITSIKGVRMLNTWGILRNINLDVDSDMNKSYREVLQSCCSVCKGTNFFEFTSARTFNGVHDFNIDDCIVSQEAIDKPGQYIVDPFGQCKVGELYDGVMWTELHEQLKGKTINITIEYGQYIYRFPKKLNSKLLRFVRNKPIGLKELVFDKSMLWSKSSLEITRNNDKGK